MSPTPDKAAWGFEPRLNQVGDTTLTNDRDDTLTPLGKELSDTLFSVLAAETLSVRPDSFSCYNLKTHMAAHPNPSDMEGPVKFRLEIISGFFCFFVYVKPRPSRQQLSLKRLAQAL